MKMSSTKRILGGTAVTVGASQAAAPVSANTGLSARAAAEGIRFCGNVSAISVTTAVSVQAQHSFDGGATWDFIDSTHAKTALTTTGQFDLPVSPWNSNLATKFPLRPMVRLVAVTGTGDSVTFDDIRICQPDDYHQPTV